MYSLCARLQRSRHWAQRYGSVVSEVRMPSHLTPLEICILFVQFSTTPDSEKPHFLRQYPEIRDAFVVDWALNAARLRGRMGEPEASVRLAGAALYIATELGDQERQA